MSRVEERLAAGWRGLNGEYRIQQPDGAVRWVRSRTFSVHAADGERYATLSSDISAARQREAQMKQMSRALAACRTYPLIR